MFGMQVTTPGIEIEDDFYEQRFQKALKDHSTFRNCAGFVKYMLGFSSSETQVSPNDVSEKGLLKYLKPNGKIDLNTETPSSVNERDYIEKASTSDVVAILVNHTPKQAEDDTLEKMSNNTRSGWMYVHFGLIDPEDNSKIYQRPDLEQTPLHSDWKDFVKCADDFKGMDSMLVFFDVKE